MLQPSLHPTTLLPDTSGEILPLNQHIDLPSNTVISDRESQVSSGPQGPNHRICPAQPAPACSGMHREGSRAHRVGNRAHRPEQSKLVVLRLRYSG